MKKTIMFSVFIVVSIGVMAGVQTGPPASTGGGSFSGDASQFTTSGSTTSIKSGASITNIISNASLTVTNSSGTLAGLNVGDTGGFATYGYTSGSGNAMFMGIIGGTGTFKIDLAGNTTASGNSTASSFIGSGVWLTNITVGAQAFTFALAATANTTNYDVSFSGAVYNPIRTANNICFRTFSGTTVAAVTYCTFGTNGVLWPKALSPVGNTNGWTTSGTNWYYQGTNTTVISFLNTTNLTGNISLTNVIVCVSGN